MNQQGRWGIEWTKVFGPGTGYTWNPISGCQHACRWDMPSLYSAECYAETIAKKVASAAYPHGFDHHYWNPERLTEPIKHRKPAGIFLDSMSDLLGHWVPDEQIEQVLDVCRQTPRHVYFLLTKNSPRLTSFKFPPNVWVGVSVPPSRMFGKVLSKDQQQRMLIRALTNLSHVDVPVRWMSIEPLSYDISCDLREFAVVGNKPILQWAVIGAATDGRKVFQPMPEWVEKAVEVLRDQKVAIFYKGNLRGNPAADPWLEEFPTL